MTETVRARYTLEFKQEAARLVEGGQRLLRPTQRRDSSTEGPRWPSVVKRADTPYPLVSTRCMPARRTRAAGIGRDEPGSCRLQSGRSVPCTGEMPRHPR